MRVRGTRSQFAEKVGDGGGGSFARAGGFGTAGGAACLGAGEHRAEAAARADAAPGPAGGPTLPGDGGCSYRRFGPWRRLPLSSLGRPLPHPGWGIDSPRVCAQALPQSAEEARSAGFVEAGCPRPQRESAVEAGPPDSQLRAFPSAPAVFSWAMQPPSLSGGASLCLPFVVPQYFHRSLGWPV